MQGASSSYVQLHSEICLGDEDRLRDRGVGISGLAIAAEGQQVRSGAPLGIGEIASTISLEW